MTNTSHADHASSDNLGTSPLQLPILNMLLLLLTLAFAIAPRAAVAQSSQNPPGQISYQGFLTDANGIPLATNSPVNYNVQFRIWNASTAGSSIWGELQVVTVDRGYFTVMLGNGSSLPGVPFTNNLSGIFSGSDASDRYLEITVQGLAPGDPPIAPRLRLLASPYSYLSSRSLVALSVDASAAVADANLSSNVALLNAAQSFTGVNAFGNSTKITGANTLEFGANVAGKEPNAGKIGYQAVTAGALDIFGAGTTSANHAIKFWAEGGSTFTGSVTATSLSGNGSGLTSLNAGQLSSGTVPDVVLSPNVPRLGNANVFLAAQTYKDSGQNIGMYLSPYDSYYQATLLVGENFNNSGANNIVMQPNGGSVGIGVIGPFSAKLQVVNATCNGSTWVNASDRNLKHDFAPVNPRDILAKVVSMPVQSWVYNANPADKHIGPVAQDFHEAFGLNGPDDTHITTVDESGVALAAIQGLNQKLEQKDAEITELKNRLERLERLLERNADAGKH